MNSVEKYVDVLSDESIGFPAYIKPKDGSSSINAYRADNLEDLKLYAEKIGDYIIQPFVSGKEYTIDMRVMLCTLHPESEWLLEPVK